MPTIQRTKSQFARLQRLDELIRSGRYPNCRTFAKEREVSEKTVLRDIDFLRDQQNAPIEFDRVRNGYYYTEKTWFLPALHMSEGDLFSLLIARQALEQYRGTPIAKRLEKAFDRIAGTLTQRIAMDPAYVSSLISFTPVPAMAVNQGVWNALLACLRDHKSLKISYRKTFAKEPKEYVINPYHVANLQGEWYVFAGTPAKAEVSQYAVGRIEQAKQTRLPFDVPQDFDATALLSNVFGRFAQTKDMKEIKVLFKSEIAPWVLDRQWHPKQKVTKRENGDVEISFPVTASGPWPFFHVKSWILSFGKNAKVLAPEELKVMVKDEVEAMGRV